MSYTQELYFAQRAMEFIDSSDAKSISFDWGRAAAVITNDASGFVVLYANALHFFDDYQDAVAWIGRQI